MLTAMCFHKLDELILDIDNGFEFPTHKLDLT
jgi:hypothetical protein